MKTLKRNIFFLKWSVGDKLKRTIKPKFPVICLVKELLGSDVEISFNYQMSKSQCFPDLTTIFLSNSHVALPGVRTGSLLKMNSWETRQWTSATWPFSRLHTKMQFHSQPQKLVKGKVTYLCHLVHLLGEFVIRESHTQEARSGWALRRGATQKPLSPLSPLMVTDGNNKGGE